MLNRQRCAPDNLRDRYVCTSGCVRSAFWVYEQRHFEKKGRRGKKRRLAVKASQRVAFCKASDFLFFLTHTYGGRPRLNTRTGPKNIERPAVAAPVRVEGNSGAKSNSGGSLIFFLGRRCLRAYEAAD